MPTSLIHKEFSAYLAGNYSAKKIVFYEPAPHIPDMRAETLEASIPTE